MSKHFFSKKNQKESSVSSQICLGELSLGDLYDGTVSYLDKCTFQFFLAGSDTLTVWRLIPGLISNENLSQREKLDGDSH